MRRMVEEYNEYVKWCNLSRSQAYYTLEDLEALFEDYVALLNKYGHPADSAPPGARPRHLRFFHLPDESMRPLD